MKQVLFAILLLSIARNAYAYDFSAVCSSGQTLYYNITSDSTVSVTYPRYYYNGGNPDYNVYYYGYSCPTGNLIIPDSVLHNSIYYRVTSIGDHAFWRCSGIHNLVIPNNVTSIGNGTFSDCSNIDSIYIGSGVCTIGGDAFRNCTNLRYMFYNAKNLSTSYFMRSDAYSSPFYNTPTPYFTKLIIGGSVNTIPKGCFEGCNSIDSCYSCYSIDSYYSL